MKERINERANEGMSGLRTEGEGKGRRGKKEGTLSAGILFL